MSPPPSLLLSDNQPCEPVRRPPGDTPRTARIAANAAKWLIAAKHEIAAHNLFSAADAVAGSMFDSSGWRHLPDSWLIGRTIAVDAGDRVRLPSGEGPGAHAHALVRRALASAPDYVTQA